MTTKEKYNPIGYRILVKPHEMFEDSKDGKGKMSSGGIFIPESSSDQEQRSQIRGTVLAIGGDAFDDSEDSIEVGDVVMYPRYNGVRVLKSDGTYDDNLLFLQDRDIICTVTTIQDDDEVTA